MNDLQQGTDAQTGGILRNSLDTNKAAKTGEIAIIFTCAVVVVIFATQVADGNPLILQAIVWTCYIVMLGLVWVGLKLRGQTWEHFGLSFKIGSRQTIVRAVLLSLAVFLAAIAAFVLGSIVGANIVGIPEQADMSGYNYLRGNLPMLIGALVAVFIGSSIAEEVIYRGFLITRLSELIGGKWATRIAVLISAIVFGLVHYNWGVMGIIQTAFMGLALGISYLAVGRNLWIPILAHGYMDAILLIGQYFAPE